MINLFIALTDFSKWKRTCTSRAEHFLIKYYFSIWRRLRKIWQRILVNPINSSQSNHVIIRQGNFGQLISMAGIQLGSVWKQTNLLKLIEKQSNQRCVSIKKIYFIWKATSALYLTFFFALYISFLQ